MVASYRFERINILNAVCSVKCFGDAFARLCGNFEDSSENGLVCDRNDSMPKKPSLQLAWAATFGFCTLHTFNVIISCANRSTLYNTQPSDTNTNKLSPISITIIQCEWRACCVFSPNSHINYFGINLFAFYLVFEILPFLFSVCSFAVANMSFFLHWA